MENEIIKIFQNLLTLVSIFDRWIYKARTKDQPAVISFSVSLDWLRQLENDSPLLKEVSRHLSKSGWRSTLTVSNEKIWLFGGKTSRFGPFGDLWQLLKVFEYGFYYFSNKLEKQTKGSSCYTWGPWCTQRINRRMKYWLWSDISWVSYLKKKNSFKKL